ncbi:MAG: UDP-glucose dehydrogenase family protein [Fibrobacterota bacterium]
MKVSVIGSGYVGLVAGACFAEDGNNVTCVDNNKEKIEALKNGEIPIYEPGLEELIRRNYTKSRIDFTTDISKAVAESMVIFIAVGTPMDEDGSADLQHVLAVAREIGRNMNGYRVIVDKSTVPVGTADKVSNEIQKHYSGEFDVVSNPEFLKEGVALNDFMKPERIVIGTGSDKAWEIMYDLYAPFVRTGSPIIRMDIKSAELTKYAANTFLATKITFMNEIASLCDILGANVNNVRKGLGSDGRIGPKFLFPGVGYGGSCFPKDVSALRKTSEENSYDFKILKAVLEVNERQKKYLIPAIKKHYGKISGKKFGIWGLSFKPNTDDMREAPSLSIIDELLKEGASVRAFDPEAMGECQRRLGDTIEYASDEYDAVALCDGLIIITEWNVFRRPDFERLKNEMKECAVFDGRNIFNPEKMKKRGVKYYCVGANI